MVMVPMVVEIVVEIVATMAVTVMVTGAVMLAKGDSGVRDDHMAIAMGNVTTTVGVGNGYGRDSHCSNNVWCWVRHRCCLHR